MWDFRILLSTFASPANPKFFHSTMCWWRCPYLKCWFNLTKSRQQPNKPKANHKLLWTLWLEFLLFRMIHFIHKYESLLKINYENCHVKEKLVKLTNYTVCNFLKKCLTLKRCGAFQHSVYSKPCNQFRLKFTNIITVRFPSDKLPITDRFRSEYCPLIA